jgi:hypothetical protein
MYRVSMYDVQFLYLVYLNSAKETLDGRIIRKDSLMNRSQINLRLFLSFLISSPLLFSIYLHFHLFNLQPRHESNLRRSKCHACEYIQSQKWSCLSQSSVLCTYTYNEQQQSIKGR